MLDWVVDTHAALPSTPDVGDQTVYSNDYHLDESWPRLGAVRTRPRVRRAVHRILGDRASLLAGGVVTALLAIGWFSTEAPAGPVAPQQVLAMLPQSNPPPPPDAPAAPVDDTEPTAAPGVDVSRSAVVDYAPDRLTQERFPSTTLRVDPAVPTRIRVVTIRARVTAYTAYDHAESKPEWADGVVAWHPHGRQRKVAHHPYGFATDWSQFPPGATFIDIPGYMEQSYAGFPRRFIVVDDACGASRVARRSGEQPVIDVRFRTRTSAISGRDAWGSRELDVAVVFPVGFRIPASLRPWVVDEEYRVYHRGARVR